MATTRGTKRERQRAAAEARATARRRQQQRRTLGYALGGVALIAVVVLTVVAMMDSGGGEDSGPAGSGEVSVATPARSQPLAPGETVPDFSAPGIGGGTVSWGEFLGRPAVLPVWAPWCPHCQVELPLLDGVMEEFPEVGFVTIVTSIGDEPGPAPAEFLSENGITAPTAVDDRAGTLARAFGIQGFPTLYFVDSAGVVVQVLEGEADEETIRSIVGSLT